MLHVLRRLWSKPTGKTEMVCDRCGSVLHEDDLGVSLNAEEYNMVICSKCLLDKNFTDVLDDYTLYTKNIHISNNLQVCGSITAQEFQQQQVHETAVEVAKPN